MPAASAEALSPWWGVTSGSEPTNLVTGERGADRRDGGESRRREHGRRSHDLRSSLPVGLQATAIKGVARGDGSGQPWRLVEIVDVHVGTAETTNSKGQRFRSPCPRIEEIEVDISVSVGAGGRAGPILRNTATVSGGGAAVGTDLYPRATRSKSTAAKSSGSKTYELVPENAGGSVDTRAGSHPFQLTSVVTLNTTTPEPGRRARGSSRCRRTIVSELPAGLLANPAALAQCTEAQFYDRRMSGADPQSGWPR